MRLVRCSLYTQPKTKCHWIMGFFCLCFTYSLSWGIAALQSCVSFRCTTPWSGIRVHLSPPSWASLPSLPPIPHPTLGSLQRSLCWAADFRWPSSYTRWSVYVNGALAILPSSTTPCPCPFSTSVSIPALQRGSSGPFFQIPYKHINIQYL